MEWYLKVLKNYAGFSGRARRKEYWMFFLFNMIISYGLQILAATVSPEIFGILVLIYSLGVLIPSIAVAVRRMHDVGKSGWFLLIPIYNLILAVTEGQSGSNEYGADPKQEGGSATSTDDNILDA
jgi:uncharacterized membrane protein YhaH (DUF805 family)